MKNVYEVEQGNSKEAITTLFTFSATGMISTPLIVYPYERIPKDIMESIPQGFAVDKSPTGWMNQDVFYDYIKNTFYPDLVEKKIEFPVVLFVDGHASHLSYKLSELCTELKIELICLPPNATRIMQPADVSCFRPIKNCWVDAVLVWRRKNVDKILTKVRFAKILKIICSNFITRETITNGFGASGLYPFDENAIDYTKCLGKNVNTSQDNGNTVPDELPVEVAIDSKRFREIVGENKWQQLSEFEPGMSCSSDLAVLHDIFRELTVSLTTIETVEPVTPMESVDDDLSPTMDGDSNETIDSDSQDEIVFSSLNEVNLVNHFVRFIFTFNFYF